MFKNIIQIFRNLWLQDKKTTTFSFFLFLFDPGSKICDLGWKKSGSGIICINIPDPQHCLHILYFMPFFAVQSAAWRAAAPGHWRLGRTRCHLEREGGRRGKGSYISLYCSVRKIFTSRRFGSGSYLIRITPRRIG
jgi:hypothetical protein